MQVWPQKLYLRDLVKEMIGNTDKGLCGKFYFVLIKIVKYQKHPRVERLIKLLYIHPMDYNTALK